MPDEKAMALAGEPDNVWVAGAVGGRASREDAEAGALAQCRVRRQDRRMRAPCRLYATGDELVSQTTP
jgi:hypothetical protein